MLNSESLTKPYSPNPSETTSQTVQAHRFEWLVVLLVMPSSSHFYLRKATETRGLMGRCSSTGPQTPKHQLEAGSLPNGRASSAAGMCPRRY